MRHFTQRDKEAAAFYRWFDRRPAMFGGRRRPGSGENLVDMLRAWRAGAEWARKGKKHVKAKNITD